MKHFSKIIFPSLLLTALVGCGPKWTETESNGIKTVANDGGKTLGYSTNSGVAIITSDRLGFKDLNKNGQLDKYEDWRLTADERAKDLASKMTVEQIAGLMLYSRHQSIPAGSRGFFAATYGGKGFEESGANAFDLTDQQKDFLSKDHVRHVLITSVQSPEVAAQWNNTAQAFVEGLGLGIPANNSSDPRHGTVANAEYNAGAGGTISMWPSSLGLAATFDAVLVEQFGSIASKEYRALGIATALSPQVDIATDPRWYRTSGTFGENPYLSADIGRAYVDGFQTSLGDKEIADGWGYESVNAMVKHWPGGGSGEAGRDAHYAFGKYAVYPGNNFASHLIPFTEGAFKLKGKTKMASAVMPYYTISYNQDTKNQENVGNAYNKYLIQELLRDKYNYDGVVCTDWLVTGDETAVDVFITGKSWGVESLSIAERHYKVLMAGVDQFGGNNEVAPVLEAYNMGVKEHGEEFMRTRFEQSAVRLLRNVFHTGLFENPYLNIEHSKSIVGKADFMKAGYDAQLKSIVMLKNKDNVLPLQKQKKVYIPKKFTPAGRNFLGMETPEKLESPVSLEIVSKYFQVTENPDEADYALVFVSNPNSGTGYSSEDTKKGGNGYVPISLQYGEYSAKDARDSSMAGGDPFEKFTNRTYKNKKTRANNITDLGMINDTYKKMKGKPVVVAINMNNPMVFSEFEENINGIFVHFGVQDQALMDILTGSTEPSALLPMQMPANMETVEKQFEDVPHDLTVYVDSEGNGYDFAYGLNWKGVINDERKI
ncbi:MAG: glycoside hydrolase family 3 N-terminal domain-containing protein [Cytophagales bacterium]|nr:glycoside hydrolase family 3 N-terminal domain-containing protein [Cytophagales bacterium]